MSRRQRNRPTGTPRRRGRMPWWVIIALLILVASVAFGRATRSGPFGVPAATTTSTPTSTITAPSPAAIASPTPASSATASLATTPIAESTPPGSMPAAVPAAIPADAQPARVVNIIDGDTIDVEIDGVTQRVRYIGIDTPERNEPGYEAATAANRALIEGHTLYLVRDQSETDVFDRLLRYLYREDGTHINAELIAQGWAQPVEYPPDTRHAPEFRQLAVEAAGAQRGFWARIPSNDIANGAANDTAPVDGVMPYGLTLAEAPIRQGPGPDFDIHITVPPQTPLTLYARTPAGDWLQVRPPSRNDGWIEAAAVDGRVPLEEIPVEENVLHPIGE